MFDNRQRHPKEIGFLEGAFANHHLRDLPGDGYQRDRIHIGIGDGRNEVRGPRPARRHANARLARGPGITVGGEGPALFVTRQDGADGGTRQRLVDFHAGAARISEDAFHPFALQRADQNVTARHGLAKFGFRRCFLFCADFCNHNLNLVAGPGRKNHGLDQPWGGLNLR